MSIYDYKSNEDEVTARLHDQLVKAHKNPVKRIKPECRKLTPREKDVLECMPLRHKLTYIWSLQDKEK